MSRALVSQSLSSTALCLFAGIILATSLLSSNRAANGVTNRISTLEFYWGKEVLSDHPAYPVLMVRDRVALWLASDADEPHMRLDYADRRYKVARSLAAQNKGELAVSALSKSQTYLLDGVRQLQATELTQVQQQEVHLKLKHSLARMEAFRTEYPTLETPMLLSLRTATAEQLRALESVPPVSN